MQLKWASYGVLCCLVDGATHGTSRQIIANSQMSLQELWLQFVMGAPLAGVTVLSSGTNLITTAEVRGEVHSMQAHTNAYHAIKPASLTIGCVCRQAGILIQMPLQLWPFLARYALLIAASTTLHTTQSFTLESVQDDASVPNYLYVASCLCVLCLSVAQNSAFNLHPVHTTCVM